MRNLSLSGDPTIWHVFGVMAVCLEQIVSAVATLWHGIRSEQDALVFVGLVGYSLALGIAGGYVYSQQQ